MSQRTISHSAPVRLVAVLAVCVLSLSASRAASIGKPGKTPPSRTPDQWAEILDDPQRESWQLPVVVMHFLGVAEGDRVADLGAGTGFFTDYLAIQVGESGMVTAIDVDPALLDYLRTREGLQQDRVTTVLAAPDDPRLEPASQDLILIVDTWHHIKKRSRYIRKLAEALRPGGRVAIIDYRAGVELPVGPPASMRLSRERVVAEFQRADWTLAAESVALPYQYFLVFSPTDSDVPGFLRKDRLE